MPVGNIKSLPFANVQSTKGTDYMNPSHNKSSWLVVFLSVIFFFCLNYVVAQEIERAAQPNKQDLSSSEDNNYIKDMNYAFARKTKDTKLFDKDRVKEMLKRPEPNDVHPIRWLSYYSIAELIVLSGSDDLIDDYLDFIVRTQHSADEGRSLGMGLLYTERAPKVLKAISQKNSQDRKIITSRLVWGLLNNIYPFLNLKNYKRKIHGSFWEVVDENYPQRSIVKQIEQEVLMMLKATPK
jgi:hypothetical protein